MENKQQTYIAYRCPKCAYSIYGIVGKFALSAKMLKLKCQCGGSELALHMLENNRIRISTPCIYCGQSHNQILSEDAFFNPEALSLPCPGTNMDITFLGTKENVDTMVEKSGDELQSLLDSLGAEDPSELRSSSDVDPDQIISDAQIYDIVRFLVKELEADNAIDCPCGSMQYDFNISDDGITIFCPICGAEYTFPADSVSATEDLLKIERLHLEKKN